LIAEDTHEQDLKKLDEQSEKRRRATMSQQNANGKADLSIPYKSRNATLNGLLTCLLYVGLYFPFTYLENGFKKQITPHCPNH
jgi:hypothetical protein